MRELLAHPLFWLCETVRWHWFEIMVTFGAVLGILGLALVVLS